MDLFFRISEVARELGANSNTIRRLIEAGLVQGQTTAGGHLRVAASELERLKREGIPTAPRPLPAAKEMASGNEVDSTVVERHSLAKPSSVEAAESAPDVLKAAEAVRVLEHATRAGELKQRLEEQQDWWRQRERQEVKEQEAQGSLRRVEEAARQRDTWKGWWQAYALIGFPHEAPAELRHVIYKAVGDMLECLNPVPANELTRLLVDGEVEKQLRPWTRSAERERAAKSAADSLPVRARSCAGLTTFYTRALQAAREAVGRLLDSANGPEIEAAANHAVEPIAAEFAAYELKESVIRSASNDANVLPLVNREKETAQKAIAEAVAKSPVASSRSELESAAAEALAPYRKAVAKRQAEERARVAEEQDRALRNSLMSTAAIKLWGVPTKEKEAAIAAVVEAFSKVPTGTPQGQLGEACDRALQPYLAAHAQRQRKEELVRRALSEVYPWLLKHETEIDLEGRLRTTVEGELKSDLEKILKAELSGKESTEQAEKFARRWLREEFRL